MFGFLLCLVIFVGVLVKYDVLSYSPTASALMQLVRKGAESRPPTACTNLLLFGNLRAVQVAFTGLEWTFDHSLPLRVSGLANAVAPRTQFFSVPGSSSPAASGTSSQVAGPADKLTSRLARAFQSLKPGCGGHRAAVQCCG